MDIGINASTDAVGSGSLSGNHSVSSRASLIFALGFGAALVVWHHFFVASPKNGDAKEPPVSRTLIPIFGHLLGFYRLGVSYMETLRRQTSWPAYTMKILNMKTYVVTSPGLSHAALRSRQMSLEPLSATVAARMLGLSKSANRHLGVDQNGKFIGSDALTERRLEFTRMLSTGSATLEEPSRVASSAVASSVNLVGTDWQSRDLFKWLRDVITMGTVAGLYGPKNPIALDPSLAEDIWIFDENQLRLSMWGVMRKWVAPAGVRAVNRISAAFETYVQEGRHQFASEAVKSTIASVLGRGIRPNDLARLEVFNISVATVNTVPTTVCMVYNILANPKLHAALRDEIKDVVSEVESDNSNKKMQIDISAATKTLPLLVACYQEALRIGSTPTCNRAVLKDTVLEDPESGVNIFMRAGGRVSIPTFMLHSRDQIWGGDATSFDPWRFMPGGAAADTKGRAREQGFVPYGGGVHLCPGRHLAKTEILASGVLMVMALDFRAERDGDHIEAPAYEGSTGAKKPIARTVRIRRREGWEDVEWSVKI
ncbi:cytochrome P450 [Lasiosphaeria ovina]|uniref:Cytochrome P450 n=1 Tax=Lasiosphaeria ovina TaxID=92902 RepID=A0AAE0JWV6_9PEZI|nr:cytochrome P450 [Lasiosphaeria ovina]